jgi:hypothetical protein
MKLTKVKKELDCHLLKLWVQDQISKNNYKKQMGTILPVVADAKIELLRDLYNIFDLDKITFDITYHNQI